ncbi:MAG: hypothetical protein M1826_001908 [Phylliscum demangeonii]|nr:MAG: hypothetical protein M1826_001908 [Phylliscum demangeonii]
MFRQIKKLLAPNRILVQNAFGRPPDHGLGSTALALVLALALALALAQDLSRSLAIQAGRLPQDRLCSGRRRIVGTTSGIHSTVVASSLSTPPELEPAPAARAGSPASRPPDPQAIAACAQFAAGAACGSRRRRPRRKERGPAGARHRLGHLPSCPRPPSPSPSPGDLPVMPSAMGRGSPVVAERKRGEGASGAATTASTASATRCAALLAAVAAGLPRAHTGPARRAGPSSLTPADPSSTAPYASTPDPRPTSYAAAATPTSDYSLNPPSSRSSTFPEYLARPAYADGAPRYAPSATPPGGPGSMAHATHPALAGATSPTYPSPASYSHYPPQSDMSPAYAGPSPSGGGHVYARPEWSPYGPPPHGMPPSYPHPSPTGPMPSPSGIHPRHGQAHHFAQVYSFVPIPGVQQHKRPRRRYEEIERMYKCGWNGCEKAYGTLNHLNAHVTMQSHGTKRTPEEFKEIRKEWKARKKDEESLRKADDDRHRMSGGSVEPSTPGESNPTSPASAYPPGVRPQLPPIGYGPGPGGPTPGHYAGSGSVNGIEHMAPYGNNTAVYAGYPPSPYAPSGPVYAPHPEAPPSLHRPPHARPPPSSTPPGSPRDYQS